MNEREVRLGRGDFRLFRAIPTRWMDNDVFGHVNNVVYYSWFDTAVNAWLVEQGHLDVMESEVVGLVVETGCTYFESVAFPETVEAGLAVEKLGRSSVTYRIGIRGRPRFRMGYVRPWWLCRCEVRSAPGPDARPSGRNRGQRAANDGGPRCRMYR
jgi:acyl-CoA thioester hydrolase